MLRHSLAASRLRRVPFSRYHLLVFLAVFGGIGGYMLLQSHAATTGTANVFVAANGSDSGANCKRFATAQANPDSSGASLCASFNQAYMVAQPGDIVGVLAGTYPNQMLKLDSTKTSSTHVTFEPLGNAVVHVNELDFGQAQLSIASAQHVTIQNMYFDSLNASVQVWNTASDILLQDLVGHALQLIGSTSTNITVKGGDWGKCTVTSDPSTNCTSRMIGQNITIDGASFHDVIHDGTQDPQDLNHTEGIFVRGCQNCTLNHVKFWHDSTYDIFLQNCCSLPPNQNVKIMNSWFASSGDGPTGDTWDKNSAILVTNSIPGYELIHNSFTEQSGPGWSFNTQGDSWAGDNAIIAGNYYQRTGADCDPNITYRNNVIIPFSSTWGNMTCNSSEKIVSTFGYVKNSQDGDLDLHETAASPGIGFASPSDSALAATDIDGNTWPATAPDTGASQFGASPPTPKSGDVNGDGKVDVVDLSILLSHYGQNGAQAQGDCNSDGKIDVVDLSVLLSHYGQ